MREAEKKELRRIVEGLGQYQAIYEDRVDIYADVAGIIADFKVEIREVIEADEKKE